MSTPEASSELNRFAPIIIKDSKGKANWEHSFHGHAGISRII